VQVYKSGRGHRDSQGKKQWPSAHSFSARQIEHHCWLLVELGNKRQEGKIPGPLDMDVNDQLLPSPDVIEVMLDSTAME